MGNLPSNSTQAAFCTASAARDTSLPSTLHCAALLSVRLQLRSMGNVTHAQGYFAVTKEGLWLHPGHRMYRRFSKFGLKLINKNLLTFVACSDQPQDIRCAQSVKQSSALCSEIQPYVPQMRRFCFSRLAVTQTDTCHICNQLFREDGKQREGETVLTQVVQMALLVNHRT